MRVTPVRRNVAVSMSKDLPPDDDTELHRIEQTKGNTVEDKSDHEDSPKTDKLPDN